VALELTKEVDEIICYDENGEEIGRIAGENVTEVMDVEEGTKSIKIVYKDGDENTVELEPQEPAMSDNVYKNGSVINVDALVLNL
jgi:hypothetical protein